MLVNTHGDNKHILHNKQSNSLLSQSNKYVTLYSLIAPFGLITQSLIEKKRDWLQFFNQIQTEMSCGIPHRHELINKHLQSDPDCNPSTYTFLVIWKSITKLMVYLSSTAQYFMKYYCVYVKLLSF